MEKNYFANKLTLIKVVLILRRLVRRAGKIRRKALKTIDVKRFKDCEHHEHAEFLKAMRLYT